MSRVQWLSCFVLYFACFLFWPTDALAWGPAVHIDLGLKILLQAAMLSPALKRLLERFPNDFLYGNISADIILGKKFIDYYYHCHNWRVGMEVLDHAKSDSQKAFAFGYLSHLAADVIAHNIFIPDKMVRTYHTLTPRHAYWEVRYDLRLDPELIHTGHRLAQVYHEKNDALLESVLRDTLFSFKTNRKIFDGLLRLQKHERVQQFLKQVEKRSPLALAEERAVRYHELSLQSVLSVLGSMERSESFKADPAGHAKLDLALEVRKKIKRLQQEGDINSAETERVIAKFHEILNVTLFQPDQCPNAEEIVIASFK